MNSSTSSFTGPRSLNWDLFFVLLLSLAPRIAICFAYSFMDEFTAFHTVTQMFLTKRLPTTDTYVIYPALYPLLIAGPTGFWAVILAAVGVIPQAMDFAGLAKVESVLCLLPGRFINVALAALTILVVYRTAKRLCGRVPALFSAAAIGFSAIHISRSSIVLPDVLGVLFCALCLERCLHAIESGSRNDFILAGAYAGLAAASKYLPGVIAVSIVVAHVVLLKREGRLLQWSGWLDLRFVYAGMAAIICFLIASPYWVFDVKQWWHGIIMPFTIFSSGHMGTFGPAYLGFLTALYVSDGTLVLFFMLGVLSCLFTHNGQSLLLLLSVVIPFAYIGRWPVKQAHYLLFIYPSLAIMGAIFVNKVLLWAPKKLGAAVSLALFIVFFGAPAFGNLTNSLKTASSPDNRLTARDWIQDNIPQGSIIAIDWEYVPPLMTSEYKTELLAGRNGGFFEKYFSTHKSYERTYKIIDFTPSPQIVANVKAEYIIISSSCYQRFFDSEPPPEGNALREEYFEARRTYGSLLRTPEELGWHSVKEFSNGVGPRIGIFRRTPISNIPGQVQAS
jgi:hypothetical protein